jgi:predicted transcriptional regulator
MVRENQIDVHDRIVKPTLQQRQQAVLNILKQYPDGLTIYEIADLMGVKANIISGRFGELEDLGKIKSIGKKLIGESKRGHHIWIYLEGKEEKPAPISDKQGQFQLF